MLLFLLNKFLKRERIYKGIDCIDIPEKILNDKVYVVGESHCKWLAVMVCPCGCKSIIQLNLLRESEPSWRIKFNKRKRVTIRPSIRRIVDCKSHFNLINGRVYWH